MLVRKVFVKVAAAALPAMLLVSCGNASDSFGGSGKEGEKAPEKVCVGVRRVESVQNVYARSYVGKVEASQNVMVTSNYPGRVEQLKVKKGRKVNAGDVIVVMSSETVKSAYDVAKATLEQARDGYDRMMSIYPDGGVTEVRKIEIETQLRKAEASFSAAEAALDKCSVKSPCSGVVDEVFVEQGMEVPVSAPFVRILNVSSVEVHIPVPENEIGAVHTGEQCFVEVPAVEKTFSARITVKGVVASALSHSYECVLVPESQCPEVLPGMVCKVRMSVEGGDCVVVPMRSVMTDRSGRYVWCVESDGTVVKKYIVCGGFSEDGIVVVDGLEDGDFLIETGRNKVSSGMKVNFRML